MRRSEKLLFYLRAAQSERRLEGTLPRTINLSEKLRLFLWTRQTAHSKHGSMLLYNSKGHCVLSVTRGRKVLCHVIPRSGRVLRQALLFFYFVFNGFSSHAFALLFFRVFLLLFFPFFLSFSFLLKLQWVTERDRYITCLKI